MTRVLVHLGEYPAVHPGGAPLLVPRPGVSMGTLALPVEFLAVREVILVVPGVRPVVLPCLYTIIKQCKKQVVMLVAASEVGLLKPLRFGIL